MTYSQIDKESFYGYVGTVQYQNQDIKECYDFGHNTVGTAFEKANNAWCRYWVIQEEDKVLATILEERNGVVIYFTTVDLPDADLNEYIKCMTELSDYIVNYRDSILIEVKNWYTDAVRLLKLAGFRQYHRSDRADTYVKEKVYGKQDYLQHKLIS